jgi:hypothetical protein
MKYACSRVALAAAYELEGADPWHRLTSKGPALAVVAGRLHPSVRRRVFEIKPILGKSVTLLVQSLAATVSSHDPTYRLYATYVGYILHFLMALFISFESPFCSVLNH